VTNDKYSVILEVREVLMKPYLTYIFIMLAIIGLFFIYELDIFWSGILASLVACIFLGCAIYFARYIKK